MLFVLSMPQFSQLSTGNNGSICLLGLPRGLNSHLQHMKTPPGMRHLLCEYRPGSLLSLSCFLACRTLEEQLLPALTRPRFTRSYPSLSYPTHASQRNSVWATGFPSLSSPPHSPQVPSPSPTLILILTSLNADRMRSLQTALCAYSLSSLSPRPALPAQNSRDFRPLVPNQVDSAPSTCTQGTFGTAKRQF